MNAVTCTQWVKRGVAKKKPDHVKLNESDIKDLIDNVQKTSLQDPSSEDDTEPETRKRKVPAKATTGKDVDPKADISDQEEEAIEEDGQASGDDDGEDDNDDAVNPLTFGGIAYYGTNKEDPNIVPDEADSDEDDLDILDDDNLIAVGRVKKDFCSFAVYVYNERGNNCFCHHDIILPTIPLCMEWLDYDGSEDKPGNLLAVGSVSPDIEIWDLDIVNSFEPAFTLAGQDVSLKSKKKKKSVSGHSDAVLSLSWNKEYKHALASGSADKTVGLWDLGEMTLVTSIRHPDKVQSVQWQPSEPQSLLTGCADATVNLFDCRSLPPSKTSWKVDGEVEQVLWDAKDSNYFLAGTDIGSLYYFDIRSKKPVFQSSAHANGLSGISQSAGLPECVVTSGMDKCVKIWNIANSELNEVYSKKMNMGQLFGVSSCPESPLLVVVAGEDEFRVLNFAKNPEIPAAFGKNPRNDNDDGIVKSGDIDVPIGHADLEDNQSEHSSDEEEPMAAAAAPAPLSKKQRKKKKATRKLANNTTSMDTQSEDTVVANGGANAAKSPDTSSNSETQVAKKKNKKKKNKKVKPASN